MVGSSSDGAPAARVTQSVASSAVEVANAGTVGLYYVREHVRDALPAVLQARGQLQQTTAAAVDGTYAANHSREFAGTLRATLPASLHRLEASLRDASWAAAEVTRRHKEQQLAGGGGGLLGGLMPQRLLGLWHGGTSGGAGSGSDGMYR